MEEQKNTSKKGKWIWLTAVIIIVAIGAIAFYFVMQNNNMKEVVNQEVIYPGISIQGIDVGGLTKDQALDKMKDIIDEEIFDKEITISYKDKVYQKSYHFFEFKSNYLEIVDKAYNTFKRGSLKDRYNKISKLKKEKIDYSIENIYNESKIEEFITSIKNDFNVEPKSAIIHRKNNEFIIDEEINGLKLNEEASKTNIKDAINNFKEEVSLVVEEVKPQYTKDYYSNVKDVIGEYTTSHNRNRDRTQNLIISCDKINGSIVYPGENFATHEVISPITVANGYKAAPIFVSGEVKDGLGGGVCQVSTTLYNAVLNAELKVVERRNHLLPVTYVELGKDATMAGTQLDFVFENSTQYPIYIESYVKGGKVVIRLYGKEERDSNRRIEFKTQVIERISPSEPTYEKDSSLAPGEEVTKRKASTGYKVKLFKYIYINDKFVEKQLVNTSYYRPVNAIIQVSDKEEPTETINATNDVQDETINATNDEQNETAEVMHVISDDTDNADEPVDSDSVEDDNNSGMSSIQDEDTNVDDNSIIDNDNSGDTKDQDIEKDNNEELENNNSVHKIESEIDNQDSEEDNPINNTNENSNVNDISLESGKDEAAEEDSNNETADEGVDEDETGESDGDRT